MKQTLLTLVFCIAAIGCSDRSSTSQTKETDTTDELSWIADPSARAAVIAYADAGHPTLVDTQGEECWNGQVQLGGSDHCFDHVRLPKELLKSIENMNKRRFQSLSDYDQRITKLYVFEHSGNYGSYMDDEEAQGLAEALNIPANLTANVKSTEYAANERGFLDILNDLYIYDEYVADTELHAFVEKKIRGEAARVFVFSPDEISLYPGGGFNVRFMLIMTKNHMIYIKNEGWNS